jgi:hypothetical protein
MNLSDEAKATIEYALNYALEGYHAGHVIEDPPTIRTRLNNAASELASLEEWEPVKNGTSTLLAKGLERYQRQIGRAALQGWYTTDVANNEITYIEQILKELRDGTLCLCRRITKEARRDE